MPPSHWRASAGELLAGAAGGPWEELLYDAWRSATLRHRDASWARALLDDAPFDVELWGVLADDDFVIGTLKAMIDRDDGATLDAIEHAALLIDPARVDDVGKRLLSGVRDQSYVEHVGDMLETLLFRKAMHDAIGETKDA